MLFAPNKIGKLMLKVMGESWLASEKSMRALIALLSLVLLLLFPGRGLPQDQQQLRYSVLFADQQGITHFRDEYLVWQVFQGARNETALVTPYLNAEKIGFLRLPQGLSLDWHPAPGKRFVLVLTGIVQVEAGDGERRTFAPGSVLLVTDTQGPGHRTVVVGEQDVLATWIPVP
jgi:hypothetical protein